MFKSRASLVLVRVAVALLAALLLERSWAALAMPTHIAPVMAPANRPDPRKDDERKRELIRESRRSAVADRDDSKSSIDPASPRVENRCHDHDVPAANVSSSRNADSTDVPVR